MRIPEHVAYIALGIALGALFAGAVCAWKAVQRSLSPAVLAPPAPAVAGVPRATLDCRPVVVYRDGAVKKRVGLPEDAQRDPAKHLTAATRFPGDEHPRTVSAVFNDRTGITDLYVVREPLPWLDARPRWTVSIDAGASNDEATWHAGVRYDALRVKRVRLGAAGHVFGDGYRYAGVGLELNW